MIGAAVVWVFILGPAQVQYAGFVQGTISSTNADIGLYLALDTALILVFVLLGAVFFSFRKAKKAGQQFWTNSTRRLLFHLFIPLVSGGIFTLILTFRNNFELVVPVILIFL